MLTINVKALPRERSQRLWALEFDREHGHVQTFGEADIFPTVDGHGQLFLESARTGGCYDEPFVLADVELWTAEDHYLAVFATEDAMRDGGRRLADAWGDELPVGVHRVLAAPPGTSPPPPLPRRQK